MAFETNKPFLLYACPAAERLARDLVSRYPKAFKRRGVEWQHNELMLIRYEDDLAHKDVVFLADFRQRNKVSTMDQLSVLLRLCRRFIRTLTIIVQSLPTGEHAFQETLGFMLGQLPQPTHGRIPVLMYDVQRRQQDHFQFYNNIALRACSAMPLFIEQFANEQAEQHNLVLVFLDDETEQRLSHHFKYPRQFISLASESTLPPEPPIVQVRVYDAQRGLAKGPKRLLDDGNKKAHVIVIHDVLTRVKPTLDLYDYLIQRYNDQICKVSLCVSNFSSELPQEDRRALRDRFANIYTTSAASTFPGGGGGVIRHFSLIDSMVHELAQLHRPIGWHQEQLHCQSPAFF